MMDSIIREGTLRLQAAESSCDVILNCDGHRLMAHKLILGIVSPVFRELLRDITSEPAVVILPDITPKVMSLLLDYVYTGSVIVYSENIQEFLSVASLLKIHLDLDYRTKISLSEMKYITKKEMRDCDEDIYSKKNQRRIPNLIPINQRKNQKLCNFVVPSPWCPRSDKLVLGDPRDEYVSSLSENKIQSPTSLHETNDSNNNFQLPKLHTATSYVPSKLNQAIQNLYLNSEKLLQVNNNEDLPHNYTISKESPISPKTLGHFFLDFQKPLKKRIHEEMTKSPVEECIKVEEKEEPSAMSPGSVSNENTNSNECGDDKIKLKYDKEKPFRCEDCGKGFSQLRNYKYHRSVHEGSKEFAARCPECGKTFNDRGYLSSHLKIHRDRKEYGCPHCPKRFNQRVAYNMHLRIHTGVKPHECPTCGKSFSRKMLLKQHQRVHTGERPYSCPECGKTFADRSNMSLHARLHTGVKPYACNLCPKSFTKKHHLKTHMNFHTGLKPYKCEKCGLAFSQSSNMRTHYKKCILKAGGSGNNSPSGASAAEIT